MGREAPAVMGARADGGGQMAKFVQICASQNDLFALDEGGSIHQYNFTAKAWEALVAARAPDQPERGERGRRR